jgi:hypothetical protein
MRRELRLGTKPEGNGIKPSLDLDALLAALTPEQQSVLAAKSTPQRVPQRVPRKNRRDPLGCRRLNLVGRSRLSKSGRWDSNPRRPAWEGGGRTRAE